MARMTFGKPMMGNGKFSNQMGVIYDPAITS